MKNADKIPHLDQQQEETVISSIILREGKNFDEIYKLIKPEDLWHPNVKEIYERIVDLNNHKQPINIISIYANHEFKNSSLENITNGMAMASGRTGTVLAWAKEIRKTSKKRQLATKLFTLREDIDKKDIKEIVKTLEDSAKEIGDGDHGALKPITFKDLMEKDMGALPFSVEKLIPAEGITIISGAPASFKTFVLLDMILCIAEGKKVWGVFNTLQSPILIMDEESGERILQKRFMALKNDSIGMNLPIHMATYTSMTYDSIDEILKFCLDKGIKLVCFDSFVRFLGNIDENSASEIKSVFQSLKKLCAAGIGVVLIHHHRKSNGLAVKNTGGEEMRGSGDILAAAHSHIIIERNDKDNTLVVRQNKLREEQERKPFVLGIESNGENIKFVYRGDYDDNKTGEQKAYDNIPEIMGRNKLTTREILEAMKKGMGIGEKLTRAALKRLVEDNVLMMSKGMGRNPDSYMVLDESMNEEVSVEQSGLF